MKPPIFVILYLLTGCLFYTATAQPAYPKSFKVLTVADGLPQSFISGLVQDSTGFIWVGTRDGLARYDGNNFKVFRHVPGDTTTLADNIIARLYLDNESRLWIYFEAGDIDILNTSTETLFHFTKNAAFKSTFASIALSKLMEEDSKGNMWMLHFNGSVFVCNLTKKTLHLYSEAALGLRNNKIQAIAADKGHIVLITHNGLVRIDENLKLLKTLPYTFSDSPNLEDRFFLGQIASLTIRSNGDLIILSGSHLLIYHNGTQSFSIIPFPKHKELLNSAMAQDNKGQIFFDFASDLYTLSPENVLTIWKPKEENPPYGFKSMLIDRSGVLWLGGNGSGIQLHDLRLPRLQGLVYKKNFHIDILKNFLNVPQNELTKTILYDIQSYYIRWTKGTNNDIWLSRGSLESTEHPQVYHYANGHLTLPPWHYVDTATASHIRINSLAFSPSGDLWGMDFFMRPVYFDTLTYAVTVYPPISSVNFDYSFTISSLLIDKEERFWISTALNGLFCYNKQSHKVIHYGAGEKSGSLPANQLMNIIQDPSDEHILWIGSLGGGLIKFNKSTGKSISFSTREGLPNNTVYAIILDKKGMLWCSSNKGIFSFDPKRATIISFTSKDGLPGDEFNRYHYLQLPDGRIAFGGVDGYTVFNPLALSKDNFQPAIALTGIQVNNVASDFGNEASPFKQAINSLNKIVLNYQQNFLKFDFAALEYNIPDKLQYRYMLEGFDKDWVNAGNHHEAAYTRLPPGHYTLKINATNTAGEWSRHIKTLQVVITPPFWQTWWFITLIIAAAIAGAYYIIQARIRYVRKQERQKIKFEHEASELKAQALRAQMNPHFVFNCLNSIKALIQEDRKKEAIIYLTTFSKLIRSQLNNAEQEVSLHDELETCKLYVQLEALRFGEKIITEFKIDKNVDTYSLKVPPLLLQPFIENAIWHGVLPRQQGKVIVSVVQENASINCLIDDDGIGREMAMNNKLQVSSTYESKGMGLVKNRLNMYNNINTNKASIEVIDKKENNKPAGTLIIIKFKQET